LPRGIKREKKGGEGKGEKKERDQTVPYTGVGASQLEKDQSPCEHITQKKRRGGGEGGGPEGDKK